MDILNKKIGFVYILTNPSFKDNWIKIIKSSYPIGIYSRELKCNAVPLPFKIFASIKTDKFNEVEEYICKELSKDADTNKNHGFFNTSPQQALNRLKNISNFFSDYEIKEYVDEDTMMDAEKKEDIIQDVIKKKRPRFKFSMVGVGIGEEVVFNPLQIKVKVVTDNKVEYDGEVYRLSKFVQKYMPNELRINSNAYQGSKYFSYKGEVLEEMRRAREYELNDNYGLYKETT